MSIPPDHNSDARWTPLPSHAAAIHLEPIRPYFQIETIEGVEPLDTQIGVLPKKTVPPALCDALFGQPEPTDTEIEAAGGNAAAVPSLQTYAILDAGKVANLPEMLERNSLEHRCLFKRVAYDELQNVAPWVVRLEESRAFTRNLFTRSDAHLNLRPSGYEPIRAENRKVSNFSTLVDNRLISCDFHSVIRLHQAPLDGKTCARTAAKG